MRIVCVIDSLGSGGAQRQLVQLAIGLKEAGEDVCFLVYHTKNFFRPVLEQHEIVVHVVESRGYFQRIRDINSMLGELRPNAVISFLEGATFICELLHIFPRKWKLIVGERSADPKIKKSIKRRIYRFFHFFANHIVANSAANLKLIQEVNPLLRRDKQHVIYNIIQLPDDLKEIENHRNNEGKFSLIVVANHQIWKNGLGLAKGINLLKDADREKIHVIWYGDKERDGAYEDLLTYIKAQRLEQFFTFKEPTNQIFDKIKESDFLGLFSLFEGLPNVVCEAMALGKIAICSNVSDVNLFLESAFIFDPNNAKEIAERIHYVMHLEINERMRVENRNKELAMKLFDKNQVVTQYLQLLHH